jgi:hypothetical protein
MPMPAIQSLELYEGDDTVWALQRLSREGNPIAITGAVIRMAIKRRYTDPELLLIVYAQQFNPELGKFALVVPSSTTKGLTGGKPISLPYDVQLTQDGLTKTIFTGLLNITPEVY